MSGKVVEGVEETPAGERKQSISEWRRVVQSQVRFRAQKSVYECKGPEYQEIDDRHWRKLNPMSFFFQSASGE